MLGLHLVRSSSCGFTNLNKCLSLHVNQGKLLKTITSSSTGDRTFSNLSRKDVNSHKLKIQSLTDGFLLQPTRCLRIPPTNKPEFDEFLGAFKNELSKFSLSDLKKSPNVHLLYGAGGLAPFILPPLQMLVFGYTDGMAWLQLAYGATILSYLGGIQWGATLPDSSKPLPSYEALGLAVAPQLVAWVSLLLPVPLGLITTSTALTATLAVDLLKQNYPPWFKSLRIFLTLGAVGSLAGTLFGSIVA